MSILDRILMILLSVASFIFGVVLLAAGIGSTSFITISATTVLSAYPGDVYSILIGIIIMALSVRFFFYRWHKRERDYVILPGDHGQVRISFSTIVQLANRAGKAVHGVQEFETRVRHGQTGVLLSTRLRVLPDTELAPMSADIQSAIKSYVEHTSGVAVERVSVNIVELAQHGSKTQRAWVE